MNNNNINNPKVEVPTGIALNAQDYMTMTLNLLKELEKNMTVALTECSNEKIYKVYKKMFDTVADAQRKSYELMFYMGWYTLEEVKENKVSTLHKNLQTQFDDLK